MVYLESMGARVLRQIDSTKPTSHHLSSVFPAGNKLNLVLIVQRATLLFGSILGGEEILLWE